MHSPFDHRLPTRLAAVLLLALLPSCGGGGGGGDRLLVFAAASLTDAFIEIGAAFEAAHPGSEVEVSFAASSALREQILEGAPADVYASANEEAMAAVVEAGMVSGEAHVFARNGIEIAVPAGNPAGVSGLDDFAREDLLLGLCARQVPCGIFGRRVLAAAGIEPAIDTDEPDVRALLTKIEAGELDAGLVYRTDVASSDGVAGIPVPSAYAVEAVYPIAVLREATDPALARGFVDFVLSGAGAEILAAHGFRPGGP
jgi:molybdate transport system substrate-binding protein